VDEPPLHAHPTHMAMRRWVSQQVLYTAATLRLADHLADGPLTAGRLAAPAGTHAPSLYGLLLLSPARRRR
jgi:hypothetical protein